MNVLEELGQYLTRPIILFCFGLPLLLPASLLVAVAFLQDDIYLTLHVIGFVLLTLSVSSIVYGTVLGCRSKSRARKAQRLKRNVTVGFERTGPLGTAAKKKRKPGSNVSIGSLTRLSSIASSPSLFRKSSLRSTSASSAPGHNLIKELVHLVDGKPETVRPNRIYIRNNAARSNTRMGNLARPPMPAIRSPMTPFRLPPRPVPPSRPSSRSPKRPNKPTIQLDLVNKQRAENSSHPTALAVRSPDANSSRPVSRIGQRHCCRKGSNFLGPSPRRPSMASPRMLSVLEEEDMRREGQGVEPTEGWSNDTAASLHRLGDQLKNLGIGANQTSVSEDSTEMTTSFGMSSPDSAWTRRSTAQWIVSSALGTRSCVPSGVRSSAPASPLVTDSVPMSNLPIMYTLAYSKANVVPRSVASPLPMMVSSKMAANVPSSVHSTTLPLPTTRDILALNTIVPPPPNYITTNTATLTNMTLDGPNTPSENTARPISTITNNPSHFATVNVNHTQSPVVMDTPAIKTATTSTPLIPVQIVVSSSKTNPASFSKNLSSSQSNPSPPGINPASSNTNPTSLSPNPASLSSRPPPNSRPPSSKLIHVVSSSNTPVISVIRSNAPSAPSYPFQSHLYSHHKANVNDYDNLPATKYPVNTSVNAHPTLTMSESNPFIVKMHGTNPGAPFGASAPLSNNPQHNNIDVNANNSDNSINTRNNGANGNTRNNNSRKTNTRNNSGSNSKNASRSYSTVEKAPSSRTKSSNIYTPLPTRSEMAVHGQTLSPASSQVRQGSSAHRFRPTSSARSDQDRARKEKQFISNGHPNGPRATVCPLGSTQRRDVDLL